MTIAMKTCIVTSVHAHQVGTGALCHIDYRVRTFLSSGLLGFIVYEAVLVNSEFM